MSMAMLLEGTRDYLREQMPLKPEQCDVQHDSIPPWPSGQFYVTLEDTGVAAGPDDSYYFKEIYSIDIGVWRRPGELPKDRWGPFQFREDPYLPSVQTLDKIERRILALLTHKFAAMVDLNNRFGLPSEDLGENFSKPLRYRGRSGMQSKFPPEAGDVFFIGRVLTLTGSTRLQKVEQQK